MVDPGLPEIADPVAETDVAPPQPRLLWPSLERGHSVKAEDWSCTDLDQFPNMSFINQRHALGHAACHSPAFRKSVRSAVRRVLIVDKYLLSAGLPAIREVLSWFPDDFEAPDVRIACEGVTSTNTRERTKTKEQGKAEQRVKAQFVDREKEINALRDGEGKPRTRLQLKLDFQSEPPPHVHDRFAIVDDELWHWGATVGGMHPGVNAASRGWSASTTKAVEFFKHVWSQPRVERRG